MNRIRAVCGVLAPILALSMHPFFAHALGDAKSDDLCPLGFPIAITPAQKLGVCDGKSKADHLFEVFPGSIIGAPIAFVSFLGSLPFCASMKTRGGDAGLAKAFCPIIIGGLGYEIGQKVGAFPFVALKRTFWDCPAYAVSGPTERTGTVRNGVILWDKQTQGLNRDQLFHGVPDREKRKPINTCPSTTAAG